MAPKTRDPRRRGGSPNSQRVFGVTSNRRRVHRAQIRCIRSNDVSRKGGTNPHFLAKGGDHGRPGRRRMSRHFGCLANLVLLNYVARAIQKTLLTPFLIDRDAHQVVGGRTALVQTEAPGAFLRIRRTWIQGILAHRRLARIRGVWNVKLRGPHSDTGKHIPPAGMLGRNTSPFCWRSARPTAWSGPSPPPRLPGEAALKTPWPLRTERPQMYTIAAGVRFRIQLL